MRGPSHVTWEGENRKVLKNIGKKSKSAADVKMEIPVLVQSLKSSILSSTNFQKNKTFWSVVSAAAEQSRCKANMVAGRTRNMAQRLTPESHKTKNGGKSLIGENKH